MQCFDGILAKLVHFAHTVSCSTCRRRQLSFGKRGEGGREGPGAGEGRQNRLPQSFALHCCVVINRSRGQPGFVASTFSPTTLESQWGSDAMATESFVDHFLDNHTKVYLVEQGRSG